MDLIIFVIGAELSTTTTRTTITMYIQIVHERRNKNKQQRTRKLKFYSPRILIEVLMKKKSCEKTIIVCLPSTVNFFILNALNCFCFYYSIKTVQLMNSFLRLNSCCINKMLDLKCWTQWDNH